MVVISDNGATENVLNHSRGAQGQAEIQGCSVRKMLPTSKRCIFSLIILRLEFATPSDLQRVWKVLMEEFFPDEPCFRSIEIFKEENLGSTGTKLYSWLFKMLVKECLKSSTSVLALNDKDEIVGMYFLIWIDCS